MEKYVVANWKANLSLPECERWLTVFQENYRTLPGIQIILAVPSVFLLYLQERFPAVHGVLWAAQDVSPYPLGRYTGAVPAAWLSGRVDFALVGHRERRKYFHETIQDVANKVCEALEEEIKPILCVDRDTARQQAAAVEFDDVEHVIVAYTPSDAEQLEISRSVSAIAEGIEMISALFPGAPVLYGGGVNSANISELIKIPGLSGVMAASGCLDPLKFVDLLNNAGSAVG